MHNSTMALSGEVRTGSGPRSAKEGAPTTGSAPAFRWWTFAVLIAYTAVLLVFCAVVTLQNYSPADALQGRLMAANPPHLPIAPFTLAHVRPDGPQVRMVCYQAAD